MSRLSLRWFQRVSVSVSLFLLLALLLTACGLTNPGPFGQEPALTSRLDTFISSEVEKKVFSGSVLIARAGKVLFSKGYSLANWTQHVPNTPQTRFRLASVTKTFTAMAILILQERGKLHVQDHICLYLSSCPATWQPITIHQLLTHTSGIPDYAQFESFDTAKNVPVSPAQLIARFKDKPLDFPPGTQSVYSNSGYILLGAIIERVSGQPYGLFLQHAIFDPLQLRHTGYDLHYPSLPDQAIGYSVWQSPVHVDTSVLFAAGGLDSTVEDLYRWEQALFTHTQTLVSQKSLDEMFTPYATMFGGQASGQLAKVQYGYGWFIGKEANSQRLVIFHQGIIYGFRAFLVYYPAEQVSIIVLSNLGETLDSGFFPGVEKIVFATIS